MKTGTLIKRALGAIGKLFHVKRLTQPCGGCQKRANEIDRRGLIRWALAGLATVILWPIRKLAACDPPNCNVRCTNCQSCGCTVECPGTGSSFWIGSTDNCYPCPDSGCISKPYVVCNNGGCGSVSWYDCCAKTHNNATTCC